MKATETAEGWRKIGKELDAAGDSPENWTLVTTVAADEQTLAES